MTRKLSSRTETELADAFRLFDGDKDDRVNSAEVLALIESLGGQTDCVHVQKLVSACETSKNGCLALDEFLQHWSIFKSNIEDDDDPEEEILKAFRGYDLDCDGYITRDEMVSALERMGSIRDIEEEAEKCMQEMDLDKDGRVSFAEFLIRWRIS